MKTGVIATMLVMVGLILSAGCTPMDVPAPTARIQAPAVSPTPPVEIQAVNTLSPQSTEDESTRVLPSETPSQKSHDEWFFTSPDGEWTVQVEAVFPVAADGAISGDKYIVRLNVFRRDGSQRWRLLEEERPFGLGYTLPGQFHWSRDGQVLYFSEHGIADGSLTMIGFDCGLFRVALDSGSINALSRECGALRAAPDDSSYALIQGGRLLVHNSQADTQREFAYIDLLEMTGEQNWQVGGLVWSPDANQLMFTVIRNTNPPDNASTSFVLVDLESGQVRFVMDATTGQYLSSEWREDGQILVLDVFQRVYLLDVDQRALVPAN